MKNWSGYLNWNPATLVYPENEAAIQETLQKALEQGKKIRIIGTGHSFTRLCETNDVLISLDKYQGLISVDKDKYQATIKGGTKLKALGDLLYAQGMGMENLGDIDAQSIAGTISTGTHGTGKAFGTISTQVIALKFVNGKGELVECSINKNKELFKAAQVSLGMMGIITEITLQCVPAYKLELQNKAEKLEEVLQTLDARMENNRNFEFYWFPYTDQFWTKTSNIARAKEDKVSLFNYFSDYVLENYGYMVLSELANKFPSKNEWVSKFAADNMANSRKVYQSHKIYATPRLVRFNEMEYNIPIEAHQEVLKEVMKLLNSKKFDINFPIENRVVKGDDIYMSPAYGRDAAYIACHAYHKKDPKPYFKALEEIFKAYDGRPHWGKMNNLSTKDIEKSYPQFGLFMKHRAEQDPQNVFVSPYIKKLFGL